MVGGEVWGRRDHKRKHAAVTALSRRESPEEKKRISLHGGRQRDRDLTRIGIRASIRGRDLGDTKGNIFRFFKLMDRS
jgi:hypothetical protein